VPLTWWALEDSNLRPQPCESDLGTRTGWFPTACDGLTRDDQDVSSDPKMANGSSCGALCGARIRRRHGGAAWRLIGGTLGATPTKTQTFTASGSITGQLHLYLGMPPCPLVSDLHREFTPSGLRGRLGPSTD
jgi:hypothetical protein